MMDNRQAELLKSWVQVPKHSDFTIYNLPFGIFRNKRLSPRVGIAIGDKIVDLSALQEEGFFHDIKLEEGVFLQDSLNPIIALGKSTTKKVRERVQQLLDENNPGLKDHQSRGKIMVGLKEAEMMIPIKIGDCTAFENLSDEGLTGYLGPRTTGYLVPFESQRKVSTIIPSGTSFHRPRGQISTVDKASYEFGASRQLDFELELAYVVGKSSKLGDSISVTEAEDYIFGMLLFNDWTARDIQAESPFLFSKSSKSFASSISYWVVTLDALEHFRTALPDQDGELIPYLQTKRNDGFDIRLEAYLKPEKGTENLICETNFSHAYWSASQLLAQQTINGSNIELGDLVASGTVSDPEAGHYSSMVELSKAGPISLEDGSSREFVQDGDTVIVKGYCEKDGIRVGFGEIVTKVLPQK
jgi:fumarylacetoacetase